MLEPNNTFAELYECPLKMLFIEHILVLVLALIHVRHTKLLLSSNSLYFYIYRERAMANTLLFLLFYKERAVAFIFLESCGQHILRKG